MVVQQFHHSVAHYDGAAANEPHARSRRLTVGVDKLVVVWIRMDLGGSGVHKIQNPHAGPNMPNRFTPAKYLVSV